MTFKKFLDNINKTYADQGDKPESERLRYSQIIMNELWNVWPKKYHEITESDKDPFYFDILHKKPGRDKHPLLAPALYDLLDELEEAWPACPANLNKDQVRIQRLEKKIKKLQASNKRHKEDLKYYKRIVRDFPWIEPSVKTTQENIELKKTLKEKNWIIRGLQDALNIVRLISDDNLNQLNILYENSKANNTDTDLICLGKIISVIRSMKKYTTDVDWR